MGLLDVLRGKREIKKPAPDRLFALTTAEITLSERMGLTTNGKAAIVFQPLATADFQQIITEMQEVVAGTSTDAGTQLTSSDDEFGYRWMVLADPDFEDLVVGLNAVSTALDAGGYGERILAAVFGFREEARGGRPAYWIYNYKRGSFYPFVPAGGAQSRDSEAELRLKAQIGAELPVEPELERWFPLWGAPI